MENLLKSPDASARESLKRGVGNAVTESKKSVNCCVRIDGGIFIGHIMKEGHLHESLVLHVTAIRVIKKCFYMVLIRCRHVFLPYFGPHQCIVN